MKGTKVKPTTTTKTRTKSLKATKILSQESTRFYSKSVGKVRTSDGLFYYRLLPSGNAQQFKSIETDLLKRGIRAERRKLATGGRCYRFKVGVGYEPILNVSPLEAFSMYPSDWDVSTGLTGGRWERVKE